MIDKDPRFEGHYPRPEAARRPWWVQLSLWGLPSRAWVVGFGWFAVACAVASLVLALFLWIAIVGVLFALAAWPYFAAVSWMDRHSAWPRDDV